MSMTSLLLRGLAIVLLGVSCFTSNPTYAGPAPQPARKVALVIGNSAYDGADRLISPANDVKLVGDTLRQLGFETRVATDLSQEEFKAAVAWLAQSSKGAQVSLFYFAGHGFESGGDNFLVPVHAGVPIRAMTRPILLDRAIRVGYVRSKVMPSAPTSFIAVIDACRVPSRGNAGPGLKPEKVGQGELIAFSTADQAPAFDSMRNFGSAIDNSPFAYYLAMNMKAPGATIKHTLDLVQQQVAELTGGQQRPWISSGLIGDVPLGAQYMVASSVPTGKAADVTRGGATRGTTPVPAAAVAASAPIAAQPAMPPGNAAAGVHVPPYLVDQLTKYRENANTPSVAPQQTPQAQRANAWDDAEARITQAAQRADRNDIAALRARGNDAAALTTLGMIYEYGYGVPRDPKAAVNLYKRAANTGYPIAQTLLGEIYFEGKLAQRDYAESEKWLARAASQDYTRARLDLAQVRATRGQGGANGMQNWADAASIMLDSVRRQQQYGR
ncbi:caspase family protein [Pandoraea apista]|uniref:Secretory immunoglobulin A-binding protein EsiB n=1 Tax=Pandoraea apista TaxID=93218 RepID=A0A0G4JCV4_9BURK|nr:caspase family protein [Pandoraea apista]ALS66649.1 hypothetical protein AT395_18165 [Pandoraea apista]OXS94608.1 hypothetical protein B7H01_08765 [Pandoraea apista]PTE00688.1 hypothetical protein C7830_13125 [Pandoraea apista]RRJ33250.1 hypothetical protein EIB05_07070 [Pandoraea apista]RRJ80385.1 hypothetical protein EIL82_09595 [Pandoraea apista]